MKIKYIFEPEDFKGCGQIIVDDRCPVDTDNHGYLTTVAYKVGYDPSSKSDRFVLISLADGMIFQGWPSRNDLCDYLNKQKIGFRPATEKEVIDIAKCQGNRFPKIKTK